jgi:integrase
MANPKLAQGIYKRGNTFWYRIQENGKRRAISLATDDVSIAITRAALAKANAPVPVAKEGHQTETFTDTIGKYIASKESTEKHTRNTSKWARLALNQFAKFVKNKQAKSVTTEDVEGFYGMLRKRTLKNGKPLSENSARSYIRAVKAVMAWTVEKRMRFDNPCKPFKLNKATQPNRTVFATKEQRDAFIAAAGDDSTMTFILLCAFHAGMRFNEIVQARPDWFHLDKGFISIHKTDTFTPKNKKNRTVPISKTFRAFLETFEMPDSTFIVEPERLDNTGKYRYNFSGRWQETRKLAEAKLSEDCENVVDLSWLCPHVARHTFASILAQSGVSIYKVALWLGDTVQVTTMHYAHLAPSDNAIDLLV